MIPSGLTSVLRVYRRIRPAIGDLTPSASSTKHKTGLKVDLLFVRRKVILVLSDKLLVAIQKYSCFYELFKYILF